LDWKTTFLQGVLEKTECRTWFFDGEIVVIWVVNVVFNTMFLRLEKLPHFRLIFSSIPILGLDRLPMNEKGNSRFLRCAAE
jgi:hypothetical protein